VPVIGLVQVGGQAMADRYTYVPLIGIFLAIVWEVGAWPLWRRPGGRRAALALAIAVLVLLGARTWQQTWIWRDSWTFWRATLAVNPRVAVAHYAIAGLFLAEGRVDAAIRAYRRALDLRPDFADAHAEVGNLLVQQGRLGAAAAHFRKALAARPDGAARDHNDLGNVLQRQGNLAAARRHLERALVLRPGFVEAHNNLGIVLADEGRLEEAAGQFRAALRIRPDFAPARSNLATVEAMLRERARDGAGTAGPRPEP